MRPLASLLPLLLLAAAPPARGVPSHDLDERQAGTTIIAEAGDRVVVRLREGASGSWHAAAPAKIPLVVIGEPAGIVSNGRRSFRYQLRGAGEAELVFVRSGAAPARLRYRIVVR